MDFKDSPLARTPFGLTFEREPNRAALPERSRAATPLPSRGGVRGGVSIFDLPKNILHYPHRIAKHLLISVT